MNEDTPYSYFVSALKSLEGDELKAMIERVHPEYIEHAPQWCFFEETYKGGREWFEKNIFRYIKEGETEHKERVERAYRFNHTRETVDLINKYIFKGAVVRNEEKADQRVKDFWLSSTLNRNPIGDFMRLVSRGASMYGRVWVCVDTNKINSNLTIADAKASDTRVYAYIIKPQNVLDFAFDQNGDLTWIKVKEVVRQDDTPWDSGSLVVQYRIWTPDFWAVFSETRDDKGEVTYSLSGSGEHNLGRVPLFAVDHSPSDSLYSATGMVDEIAYLDRAVANYLSNLDTIIQDQTFSQLVMPAQGLMPGDDAQSKLMELGLKRIFTYDGQAGTPPQYISPDAEQAGVILDVINKIISEIYHSIGMAGERTKQDNSMGIDNSSGVAKAYDFDRMNAMLASKARALEICENTLCEFVALWNGEEIEAGAYTNKDRLVIYPENFDIRGLGDELDLAQRLLLLDAPELVRKTQMGMVVDKIFPNISDKLANEMKSEIDNDWLEEELLPETPPVAGSPAKTPPVPGKENRQGETTSEGD